MFVKDSKSVDVQIAKGRV